MPHIAAYLRYDEIPPHFYGFIYRTKEYAIIIRYSGYA